MGSICGLWYNATQNSEAELDSFHDESCLTEAFRFSGLLRIRRYESLSEGPRYFSLFEYESTVEQCPEPFAWFPSKGDGLGRGPICEASQVLGRLTLKVNSTIGGTATTIRLRINNEESLSSLISFLEARISPLPGITSVSLWLNESSASSLDRTSDGDVREAAILIEGVRPGSVAAAWTQCAATRALNLDWQAVDSTAYRLLQVTSRS